MAFLVRQRNQRQPTSLYSLDPSHPLANGLRTSLPTGGGYDHFGRKWNNLNGLVWTPTDRGIAVTTTGTTQTLQGPQDPNTAVPFSISCWVRLHNTSDGFGPIGGGCPSESYNFYSTSIYPAYGWIGISAVAGPSTYDNQYATGLTISTETWYCITAVFASTTQRKLYWNGVQRTTGTVDINPTPKTDFEWWAGGSNRAGGPYSVSGMDVINPLYWNRVITDEEVEALYHESWAPWVERSYFLPLSTAAGGDVTAALTGQSVAVAQGTLSPQTAVAISGQSVTLASGLVVPASAVALTGQQNAVGQGTLVPNTSVALSGQNVVVGQGSVTAGSDVVAALTGQALSAAQGSLSPATSVALSGQGVTLAQGSVTAVIGVTAALTGQALSTAQGSLSPATAVPLSGQSVTVGQGSVTAESGVVVALTGLGVGVAQGSIATVALQKALTGQEVTASAGNVAVQGVVVAASNPGFGGGGSGGGRRLRKEIDELDTFKEIESKLKRGLGLKEAIKELKAEPETQKQAAKIEKKALKRDPEAIKWIAEQLQSREARAKLPEDQPPPAETEDYELQLAILQEENDVLRTVVQAMGLVIEKLSKNADL